MSFQIPKSTHIHKCLFELPSRPSALTEEGLRKQHSSGMPVYVFRFLYKTLFIPDYLPSISVNMTKPYASRKVRCLVSDEYIPLELKL